LVDELLLFAYFIYSLLDNIPVGVALDILGYASIQGRACRNLILRQLAVEVRTVLFRMVDGL